MKRVTVLGATGYTGRLICENLAARGISFSVAVRHPDKVPSYSHLNKIFKTDLKDKYSIQAFLSETDILVNCVGPYMVLSRELMDQVRQCKIYYLDLTGEQSFVKESYDCSNQKACLIHSCSFESALADLLAFRGLDRRINYRSIDSYYYFESSTPSAGTRFTMKVHSYFDQFEVKDAQLLKVEKNFARFNLSLPRLEKFKGALFTPYPEVLFFHKNFKVQESASFLVMEEDMIHLALERDETKRLPLEKVVERLVDRPYPSPSVELREKQYFRLAVQAVSLEGESQSLMLSGHDMYAVTAGLATFAVQCLLQKTFPYGVVLSPAEAFYGEGMLEDIIERFSLSLESASRSSQNPLS